jgi:hypothetical protein
VDWNPQFLESPKYAHVGDTARESAAQGQTDLETAIDAQPRSAKPVSSRIDRFQQQRPGHPSLL